MNPPNRKPPSGLRVIALTFILVLFAQSDLFAHPRDKTRWDKKYDTEQFLFGKQPIAFLKENLHLLPKGKVLDIAMGEGRNGVYLAVNGFQVTGLDISATGLEKAHRLAAANNTSIETQVVDLQSYRLKKNAYDVIICTYYLQRDLFPQIMAALKPGGMVLIETYNVHDVEKYRNIRREWALEFNELLTVFQDFKIIRYQAKDTGREAFSSILAQKPSR